MWYDSIIEKIKKFNVKVKEVEIKVNPEDVNNVVGYKRENLEKLKHLYDVEVKIVKDENIKQGKFEINILKKYTDFFR